MQGGAASVKFRSYLTLEKRKEMTSGKPHIPTAKERERLYKLRQGALLSWLRGVQPPRENQRKSYVMLCGCQTGDSREKVVTVLTIARLEGGNSPGPFRGFSNKTLRHHLGIWRDLDIFFGRVNLHQR